MKIGIIIQARLGSTRLPGKILKPFYENKSILDIILHNLHKIAGTEIIVATSNDSSNDPLSEYLEAKHEKIFRGSENDVLQRFISAADYYNLDGIIRICSDNPFIDYKGVEYLINKAKNSQADYIGYKINNTPSIKTHFGFWGEYVRKATLMEVCSSTPVDSAAHEHVTIHVYSNPQKYSCEWINCPLFIQGRDDIRLTIDTKEDFINAQKVYTDLISVNDSFELKDVVNYLDSHEELKQSMKRIINQNTK